MEYSSNAVDEGDNSSNKSMKKLKDEYDQRIKTLKLENQVKVLKLEKQVSNQETIIQKLKHEAEMAKMRIEQEQRDLESRRTMAHCARDKEESEYQIKYLTLQRENEALRHELELNKLKSEGDQKEAQRKIKQESRQKMVLEKEIESLKEVVGKNSEEASSKEVGCQTEEKYQEDQDAKIQCSDTNQKVYPLLSMTIFDKLCHGVNVYFEGKGDIGTSMYSSYQNWYKDITSLIENKVVYIDENFIFMKKEFMDYFDNIRVILKYEYATFWENQNFFVVNMSTEEVERQKQKKAKFSLLHPSRRECSLTLKSYIIESKAIPRWNLGGITKDFYFGKHKSMIIFGEKT